MLNLNCQGCGTTISSEHSNPGEHIRCPLCNCVNDVPTTAATIDEPGHLDARRLSRSTYQVRCPQCHGTTNFRASSLGGSTRCRNCSFRILLPSNLRLPVPLPDDVPSDSEKPGSSGCGCIALTLIMALAAVVFWMAPSMPGCQTQEKLPADYGQPLKPFGIISKHKNRPNKGAKKPHTDKKKQNPATKGDFPNTRHLTPPDSLSNVIDPPATNPGESEQARPPGALSGPGKDTDKETPKDEPIEADSRTESSQSPELEDAAKRKSEFRRWTSTVGSTLWARLVSVQLDHVKLEKENGSIIDVELNKLSASDQEYVARVKKTKKR